ncbi:hypothetical protein APSETT444_008733 [Aspergillus pseudonomiae]
MHEALTIDPPASQNVHDSRFAALYELGGGITELFAKELILQSGLTLSSQEPLVILDNACGTGAVSSVLHRTIGSDKKGNWQLTCGDRFEQAGLSNIQVRTVRKERLFPMDQFVESCTVLIPMIVNTFWTQDQRRQHVSELPLAIRRYAEGKFGMDGLASLEAEAIIATGRKS